MARKHKAFFINPPCFFATLKQPNVRCKPPFDDGLNYQGGTTVGMLRVMSRRGDERVTWDEQKIQAGDPEALAAIREAERIFAQERAKGATAFRIDTGKPAQRIEQFDRTAEQIVLVPRVVGG
jgi:hypothetical protein